jgi:hypothetical protein
MNAAMLRKLELALIKQDWVPAGACRTCMHAALGSLH